MEGVELSCYGQIGQETEGFVVRRDAKKEELAHDIRRLSRVESLIDHGLIQFGRLADFKG